MKLIQSKGEFMLLIIFLSIVLFMIYYMINMFSYFDPARWCYVKIEGDIVSGSETTIRKAILVLKKDDPAAYESLCHYVDRVSERNCIVADHKISKKEFEEGWHQLGCYVRGTKTIYLKPTRVETEDVIQERAWVIKKYTEYSKNFWDNYKK